MPKTLEEILQEEYIKSIKGMESVHTTHFPLAYKEAAINAAKVYARQEAELAFEAGFDFSDRLGTGIDPNKEQYVSERFK